MLLIPAIDIKGGKCVRLRQGNLDDETIFSNDPVSVASGWVEAGAKRIHIVDLDGATEAKPRNKSIIHEIVERHPDVPVQVGGGIRDEDTIEAYLDVGVQYVILGTKAVTEPHLVPDLCAEFPGHIIVGLDAKDGKVATDGWSKLSHHDVLDLARQFEQDGVEAFIFTDISRDGMLTGVNLEATVQLAQSVVVPVIASGGISSLNDVRALCAVESEGVSGAITGRAVYEGTLDFAVALEMIESLERE